ncbi:MAG: DUF447 family protein [Thermogladius sp.]|nr:DUF447 family protein [Thermogladius sp.]
MLIRLVGDVVYESIASAYAGGGVYYTPLGFRPEGLRFQAKVYPETGLYSIVDKVGFIVLNLTRNPVHYLLSSFKKEFKPNLAFTKARCVDAPRLAGAEAYVETIVAGVRELSGLKIVELEPVCLDTGALLTPYSRADAMLIEMIVYATKIRAFKSKGDEVSAGYYANLFKEARSILERVAGSKSYRGMADFLSGVVSKWVEG